MKTKKVIITGVSGGIGKGLAKVFQEDGYHVVGLDKTPTRSKFVNDFIAIDLNQYCLNHGYRRELNFLLIESHADTHVLINNAAVQKLDHLEHITIQDWTESFNVNVTAAMLLSQLMANILTLNSGSIINIGSIHQDQTKPAFISYATTKAALVGLTKALSVDLKGQVRVNCISPAAVKTNMLLQGFGNDNSKINELQSIHPLGRIGKAEEVGELALFLAGEKARFIHGANIQLDGGISNVLKDLD
jgi:NAD(P)-dependent dehydrogenase (short-subunit alcohol dehydrogenase family)